MFLSNNKKRACSRCYYESSGQAQREIFKYIEIYYNIKRMHSSLESLSISI
ncbi:IS3 family transposase [Clostridium beijerinckii]|uniref:IS3 family transposase n=1 Tax=Clostridium beijerinckii TaxID=1520 RepID=UPI003AAF997A